MVTTYKRKISQNSNTQELFATQKHDMYKSDPNSIPARKTCNGGDGGSVWLPANNSHGDYSTQLFEERPRQTKARATHS